jgi:phosphoadenosine phosphosulfate reductase
MRFMGKFTQEELNEVNKTLFTPEDCLKWAFDNIHPKLAKASSFGAEDAAIVDMMFKLNSDSRLFTLDTGRLPQATYDVMDEIRKRYNTKIEILFPDSTEVEEMVKDRGVNLFYDSIENRKLCCAIRKVHPMNKMLKTLDGWITGLRNDQNQNRSGAKMLEIDEMHDDIVKVNPLINWTYEQTWDYVKSNNCPYNKLLDEGYPSIGCEPCTRPIKIGEDTRAGRWWWENDEHKECGLHMNHDN